MYKEFNIKGSIFTILFVSIILLIGLVSVQPSISTAYAMHPPPDLWPYPEYDELVEAHNQVVQALNIQVEDVLSQ